MKKLALISSVLALGLAISLEGNFLQFLIILIFSVYLIGPALLIIGLWTGVAARRGDWRPWHTLFWKAAGIVILCIVLSGLLGEGLHGWRVRQTRDYVSRAVKVLDEYHAKRGQYPDALPVDAIGQLPKWLRHSGAWTLNRQDFRFEYWDPAGLMSGYEFTSGTREWVDFD